MRRTQLVTRNVFRNRRRTLLTVGSIAAFFFLFTLLSTVYHFIDSPAVVTPVPPGC